MQEDKQQRTETENTTDSPISSRRFDHPTYLDSVKQNLQMILPQFNVLIVEKQIQEFEGHTQQFWAYSIILTSSKVFREKFQIFTQAFLNQKSNCLYVRHLITHNHLQPIIQNKQAVLMALNLCNKINMGMGNFKIAIDPTSGKTFFETKSFINQTSLQFLKKKFAKPDFCFYTEIIFCSIEKSEKYIDLILFLLGQLSLSELTKNTQIQNQFPFLKESNQIIKKIEKNIFYIPFLNNNPQKDSVDKQSNDQQSDVEYNFFKHRKSQQQEKVQRDTEITKLHQEVLSNVRYQILNNSLQFFCSNTQKTLKLFTTKNLYQNIDFSTKPLYLGEKSQSFDKTIIDIDKQSSVQCKRILTFIQVVQVEGYFNQDQYKAWKKIYEGGFGIIQVATIRYKNLSSSYKESDSGFSFTIKQQMIRKRDKNMGKNKIQRQRNVLQKLTNFSHPNIASFYISFQTDYEDCIFSEYTPNMSLDLYLKKNEYSMNFSQKISLMRQAVEGLMFLHERKIVHLDIKPGNMLINKKLLLLLSDFGEAFLIGQNNPIDHNHAYTIPYCAPQVFKKQAQLTQKADIYAIGVCIFKVILGQDFLNSFLQKKFVKRLCEKDLKSLGVLQKYQKSFMYPIIKIILMIAHQAVNDQKERRPNLYWIAEILTQCRNFILTLLY